MKYILILILFVFQLFGSALNNADSLSTPSDNTSTGVTKEEILKFNEKVPTESSVSAEEQKALQVQKTITKATDFFVPNVSFSSCVASCPIKPEYEPDFYAKVDKFDINSGTITCSVLVKADLKGQTVIQSKTIINQQCVKQIENTAYQSKISQQAISNNDALGKSIQNSISINSQPSGNLDLADFLDALVTFNPEIIDIQKSMANGSMEFTSGITFDSLKHNKNKAQAIDYARSISSSFFSSLGISELNPMSPPVTNISTENQNEKFLSKFLLFFMEMLLVSGSVMSELLFYIFLASILWGVIDIALSWKKEGNIGAIIRRVAFSIAVILVFFSSSESTNVTVGGQNITMDSSRAQNWFSSGNQEINSIMDSLVQKTWSAYLKNLSTREGVVSSDTVKNQEKESNQLKAKNTELQKINDTCFNDYNMVEMKQYLGKIRTEKQQNQVYANPFPTQEEMAKISQYKRENDLLKYGSPSISLSACHDAKQGILSNQVKIDGYEKNIQNFNNPAFLKDKSTQIVALNDYFLSLQQKYGYLSIVFLPAAEMVYGLKDFIEDTFAKKWESYKTMDIQAISTGALQNSAMLTLLPLDNVIAIMSKISSVLPTSWIPFGVGDKIADLVSLALIIFSVDFFVEALQYTKVIVFFLVATYAFMLVFAEKLLAYLKLPFAVIWALATNQKEKIVGIIANVIYVTLKVILLFVAILTCLFILFIIDNVADEFIQEIPKLAYEFGFFAWLITSFMSGFMIILKIILEVAVIISCLHYIPRAFATSLKL
jgi:hypothetical protein